MSKTGNTHCQKELKRVSEQTKLEISDKSSMRADADLKSVSLWAPGGGGSGPGCTIISLGKLPFGSHNRPHVSCLDSWTRNEELVLSSSDRKLCWGCRGKMESPLVPVTHNQWGGLEESAVTTGQHPPASPVLSESFYRPIHIHIKITTSLTSLTLSLPKS